MGKDVCSELPILAGSMMTSAAVAKASLSTLDHALL